MNDMTGAEIEKAFGFPGEVEFEGKKWEADRIGLPQLGEVYWLILSSCACREEGGTTYPKLILKPKPQQLTLADVPVGAVVVFSAARNAKTLVVEYDGTRVCVGSCWYDATEPIESWYWPGKESGK